MLFTFLPLPASWRGRQGEEISGGGRACCTGAVPHLLACCACAARFCRKHIAYLALRHGAHAYLAPYTARDLCNMRLAAINDSLCATPLNIAGQ